MLYGQLLQVIGYIETRTDIKYDKKEDVVNMCKAWDDHKKLGIQEEIQQGMLLYEGMENRSNIIIDKDCTRIGQGDEADAVIGKDTISHFHAVINRENQEFYLEDLNSTNGTFVNNEVLAYKQKKQLKSNDIIRFADVKYRFV